MNDNNVNAIAKQIGDAIGQLNEAARPLLAHGWEVYTRQQFISGVAAIVINLLVLLPLLVASAIFLPKLFRWAKGYVYAKPENEGCAYLVPGILSFAGLVVVAFTIHNLVDGAMHMINPEYYAFQDILAQLGLSK